MDIPGVDLPTPGEIAGGVGGFFGGLAEDASQAVIDYVIEFIYTLIAQAVAVITAALAGAFNGPSTRVDLTGGWFASEGGSTVTAMTSVIAGSLVLVFLLLSLVRAMAAGEFSTMWRAALVDVPVAFLATSLTVVVASALLTMVDEASASLLGDDGAQLAAFGESLTDVERLSVAGLLGILFGLLFIIGAVLVWIQLLVRAALIYVVIAFAPITWVTRAYPGTRGIARRGVEIAVALIVSKFVMAISFRLGVEALASAEVPAGDADLSAMLVGSAIMLMTAFMPWMIFKIIPVVESATAASGPDRAVVGAAVVGGGLAFAGMRALASGGAAAGGAGGTAGGGAPGPGEVPGGDAGPTPGPGRGGSGSAGLAPGGAATAPGAVGGGAENRDRVGGGGPGDTGRDESPAGSDADDGSAPAAWGEAAPGNDRGETGAAGAGSAQRSAGGVGGGFSATPLGGSPGVGVIEVEVDRPVPVPQPGAGAGSGAEGDGGGGEPRTLGQMRRSDP